MNEEFKRLIRPNRPDGNPTGLSTSNVSLSETQQTDRYAYTQQMNNGIAMNEATDKTAPAGNVSPATFADRFQGNTSASYVERSVESDSISADAGFDVFELPIDTDVKGDADISAGYDDIPGAQYEERPNNNDKSKNTGLKNQIDNHIREDSVESADPSRPATERASLPGSDSDSRNGVSNPSNREPVRNKETHVWPRATAHPARRTEDPQKTSSNTDENHTVAAKKSRRSVDKSSFGSRTFKQNTWGRNVRSSSSDENRNDESQSENFDRRIFGSATEARRQRKGRGVSAAAAAIVGQTEKPRRVDSALLLQSTIEDYRVVDLSNPRRRDETYRKLPGQLPASWSSKLVDCQTREYKGHRVMFLWNEVDLRLFVYDTATNEIKGTEIEAHYVEWEFSPKKFQSFIVSNGPNGNRNRFISRVWPFSRTRR